MTQEALKLALEALIGLSIKHGEMTDEGMDAIAAIKEALAKEKTLQALHSENERLGLYKDAYAQQEQFCDANCVWTDHHPDCRLAKTQEPSGHFLDFAYSDSIVYVHVYDQFRKGQQFYKSPPQRTWVGLTLDEIALLHANYPNPQGFALALQAKLKEKE